MHDAIEKYLFIREKFKMTQSHQKSYANVRKWDIELDVYDWVYMKISFMKGVMRFCMKGKLSPC